MTQTTKYINDDIREMITMTVEDLVTNLLLYDRQNEEELSKVKIEKAIKDGVITINEIVKIFEKKLIISTERL